MDGRLLEVAVRLFHRLLAPYQRIREVAGVDCE